MFYLLPKAAFKVLAVTFLQVSQMIQNNVLFLWSSFTRKRFTASFKESL